MKFPLRIIDALFEDAVITTRIDNPQLGPPVGCQYYDDSGFCRVTGSPCPHFQSTFEKCTIRIETPPSFPLVLDPNNEDK